MASNGPLAKQLQCDCHDTLPWLISFSLGLMNAWFRRLLLILTIGGGFMGVAVTTQFFSQANKVIAYIALLFFVGLYAYGIFVGLKLSEGSIPIRHLRLYFGLQIPFISSPVIAYRFCSGFEVTVAILQLRLGYEYRLGSGGQFAILSSAPWGIGVNLVALAIVFLLYSRLAVVPGHARAPNITNR